MDHSSKRVVLAQVVATFRNGLPPHDCEAFNECLVHVYLDPDGKKTGRTVLRMKSPLVFYVHAHADGRFWLNYFVHTTVGNTSHTLIEIFAAGYL